MISSVGGENATLQHDYMAACNQIVCPLSFETAQESLAFRLSFVTVIVGYSLLLTLSVCAARVTVHKPSQVSYTRSRGFLIKIHDTVIFTTQLQQAPAYSVRYIQCSCNLLLPTLPYLLSFTLYI